MADDDEDDEGVPGPVIMFAIGLVAIGLGLALALMECRAGQGAADPGDPSGRSAIQKSGDTDEKIHCQRNCSHLNGRMWEGFGSARHLPCPMGERRRSA